MKVLDTVSREDAAQAMRQRRNAIVREMGGSALRYGAFPFLLHCAYDMLIRQIEADGRVTVAASLDAWASYLALRRKKGKKTEAASLKARFSELGEATFGGEKEAANGITVDVAITRPHKRRSRAAPGRYGLTASFSRRGRRLAVERAERDEDVLAADMARAEEEAKEERLREQIIRDTVGRLAGAGLAREAAQLQAYAKRKWRMEFSPAVAVFLLYALLLAGCGGAVALGYTVYRLVTYEIHNETPDGSLPSRLRDGGPPRVPGEYIETQKKGERELVFAVRDPETFGQALAVWETAHLPADIQASVTVTWMWKIQAASNPPVYKRTRAPQLVVQFEEAIDPAKVRVDVRPIRDAHWARHASAAPAVHFSEEPSGGSAQGAVLIMGDRTTYEGRASEEHERDLHIEWVSETYAIFTQQHPERYVGPFRSRHIGEVAGETHIEWRWELTPAYMTNGITKLTENAQLHVIFDRPRAEAEPLEIRCRPFHADHRATNTVRVGDDGRLHEVGKRHPGHEVLDKTDVLVLGDPRTYDEWTRSQH